MCLKRQLNVINVFQEVLNLKLLSAFFALISKAKNAFPPNTLLKEHMKLMKHIITFTMAKL